VVARRSDPVKPLRTAWKHRARGARAKVDHLGGEGHLLAWQGRFVVPYFADAGVADVCAILDRTGDTLQTIATPEPHGRLRSPSGPVITWPDETLALGILDEQVSVMWVDFGGASQVVSTDLAPTDYYARVDLLPSSGGEVFASVDAKQANPDGLGWSIDPRLDSIYLDARRAPFHDHEQVMRCVGRTGVLWSAPGRPAAVADEIVIAEEGSGSARAIVARKIADGGELWRREAIDRFVLGTIPMPAWSDDRVYVLDRGDRRRQSWAREAETARIHGIATDAPMRTLLSIPAVQRARRELVITAPSIISCWSTRTGEPLWQTPVDGDVVSFRIHADWVAAVITGALRVWRHDGSLAGEAEIPADAEPARWPPDPARWPSLVHGDAEHLYVAENRAKPAGPRLYEARLGTPRTPIWEVPLPQNCVDAPVLRSLRLFNRVPIAFTQDAAVLRWGKQLYGFLA
jgi:hypothetical protein